MVQYYYLIVKLKTCQELIMTGCGGKAPIDLIHEETLSTTPKLFNGFPPMVVTTLLYYVGVNKWHNYY